MQQRTENILRVLIKANIERKERNTAAMNFVQQSAVKSTLSWLAQQSDGFISELDFVLCTYGGSIGDAAIVHAEKNAFDFQGCDSDQAVLVNWAKGEDVFLETYKQILHDSKDLDNMLFEKIRAQKSELDECQQRIAAFKLNL